MGNDENLVLRAGFVAKQRLYGFAFCISFWEFLGVLKGLEGGRSLMDMGYLVPTPSFLMERFLQRLEGSPRWTELDKEVHNLLAQRLGVQHLNHFPYKRFQRRTYQEIHEALSDLLFLVDR